MLKHKNQLSLYKCENIDIFFGLVIMTVDSSSFKFRLHLSVCCLLGVAFLGESTSDSKFFILDKEVGDNIVNQPCYPYDSCFKRCIEDITRTKTNIGLRQFNCFCDKDCKQFGDCCWDYETYCLSNIDLQTENEFQNSEQEDDISALHDDSFECVIVDEYSKGSYWMVTRCAEDWIDREIEQKCHETDIEKLDSFLPVVGETSWTYRNIYCAQCNYVNKYLFWSLKATCIRSAPEEVLMGDPEILSYYLLHFCTLKLQHEIDFNHIEPKSNNTKDKVWPPFAWKNSLRPCVQNLIGKCPDDFPDEYIKNTCQSYQSIVINEDSKKTPSLKAFKNPYCGYCHGMDMAGLHRNKSEEKITNKTTTNNSNTNKDLTCPLWLLTNYYDNNFWKLTGSSKSAKILSSFNRNYISSSWIPPSFSVLIRFKEEIEMLYQDDSSNVVTIPSQKSCKSEQFYDPFLGICRTLVCAEGMEFSSGECVPVKNTTEIKETLPPSYVNRPITTVTITITIPKSILNKTNMVSFTDLSDWLVKSFEKVLNVSYEGNVTINVSDVTVVNNTQSIDNSDENDNLMELSVSFVLFEVGMYTEDDIIKIIKSIGSMVNFDQLVMKMDSYSIVVVEYVYPKHFLTCEVDEYKVEYKSSDYELREFDGRSLVFIKATNKNYSEGEFQLLDWIIDIDQTGIETKHLQESRVLVCSQNGLESQSNLTTCHTYAPLNSSEYIILENHSLYLTGRNIVFFPDQFIEHGDSYAVCIDGFIALQDSTSGEEIIILTSTDIIMSWVTFGLTIFSLCCLSITLVTYVLFRDLRTVSGWNIVNLIVALFAALLVFSFGANLINPPELCMAIAIVLHYLYLATFFWNNVMAYDVWITFGKGIKQPYRMSMLGQCSAVDRSKMVRKSVMKYMLYGWGAPLLLVGVCIMIEFAIPNAEFGYQFKQGLTYCWISNPLSNILSFGVPLALILLINAVFFVFSIKAIHGIKLLSKKSRPKRPPTNSTSSTISTSSVKSKNEITSFSQTSLSKLQKKSVNNAHKQTSKLNKKRSSKTDNNFSVGSARVKILIYIKMSTVMGFTWFTGFVSALFPEIAALRYIFEILVPLQGVFIFVAFICKKSIFRRYQQLIKGNIKKDEGGSKQNISQAKSEKQKSDNLIRQMKISEKVQRSTSECTILKSSSNSSECSFVSGDGPDFQSAINSAYSDESTPNTRSQSSSSVDDI